MTTPGAFERRVLSIVARIPVGRVATYGDVARLAGIKHLNRLENVLARAEWSDPAIFEGLLCDDSGMVISGGLSPACLAASVRGFPANTIMSWRPT